MSLVRQTFSPIVAIAINTFREAVRNKVLGSLLGFAVLVVLLSLVLAEMSLHHEVRITQDFALFSSTLFGALIAIYSSVTLLQTEFERRTLYTILSKPIARWQFLVGKFLGIQALLFVVTAIMSILSLSLGLMYGAEISSIVPAAYFTIFLQLSIVAAVTLFFASFSSPLLSGLFAGSIFIAGNLVSQMLGMRAVLKESGAQALVPIVEAVATIVPNFESLNLSRELTHDILVPGSFLGSALWYAASYTALVLLATIAAFNRRDFQ